MKTNTDQRYGLIGWKEFQNTRCEILAEFNRSKRYNVSRPVRTEHGIAGEAELRKWLSEFLPRKFGVTSGYVIPDIMATEYKLYHFDIVIYDAANSPILWTDGDQDHSEQGRRRAIPAKHVRAVFESKASLTAKDAGNSIDKLAQLNNLVGHLPQEFSCGSIFFDLDPSLVAKRDVLHQLIPARPVVGYWGGMVLYCALDEEMTGLFEFTTLPEKKEDAIDLPISMARNLNDLKIHRDEAGNVTIGEQGAGVLAFAGPDRQWHYSKLYSTIVYGNLCGLMLTWSHNGFSTFALDLLSRLEGVHPKQDRQYMFGQVFDEIR